jgi:type IV pilus assembly protein PilC
MFFSARIALKPLAGLCRHMATALSAGVDIRKVLAREAQQAWGPTRSRMAAVRLAVDGGESFSDALGATGEYFPLLFREMVAVGEQSGQLAEVLGQLAEHYELRVQLRRNFLSAIAWPMFQLCVAVCAMGLLIWVMGFIGQSTGMKVDILGLGLMGDRGLAIYAAFVAAVAVVLAVLIRVAVRGGFWGRPIQLVVLRVPVLGPALATLALARLSWSLYVTMNAGMELRRSLRLSIRSSGCARYIDAIDCVDREIAEGNSLYLAFYAAECFPLDFLDAVQVGEQSGKLVESMARLSRQYQDRARAALATLTTLAGFGVWVIVAALIIVLIFRIAFFYLGTINSMMK